MPAILSPAIPLFAKQPCSRFKMLDRSILSAAMRPSPLTPFVPLASRKTSARSGGRPTGRRVSASPWTATSTMAGLATIGRRIVLSAALLTIRLPAGGTAQAQSMPIPVSSDRALVTGPIAGFVAEAAQRFGLPASWIETIIAAESAGDPHAVSPKGALGLMQLMPATWEAMRGRLSLGGDPFDPRANILAGTAFLREMHDRYGSPGFLAAYSAGPARYEEHLATGRPLPAETRAYLAMLEPRIDGKQADGRPSQVASRSWTTAPLFVIRTATAVPVRPSSHRPDGLVVMEPHAEGLFVRLGPLERRP